MNNAVRSGISIVVVGVGIAGLLIAPAVSQARREERAVERKPEELWRLYPLDPEAERKDQSTRAQASPSPGPVNEERSEGRGEVSPEDGAGSGASALIAITFGGVGAVLIVMTFRRAMRPATRTHSPIRRTQSVSGPEPVSEPQAPAQDVADPSLEKQPEPGLVRVHLKDGRTMKGAVKHGPTRDSPVLLLDVVDVSDAQGHKRDPEPLDAFVPLVEIGHIEAIDDTDGGWPDSKEPR
jgi:hypothetical protein